MDLRLRLRKLLCRVVGHKWVTVEPLWVLCSRCGFESLVPPEHVNCRCQLCFNGG